MPQGAVTSMDVISAAKSGTYRVGDVSKSVVADAAVRESNPALYDTIMSFPADVVPAAVTGSVQVDSLASWTNHGTGLEATKGGEFKHEVRQFQKPYDNQQAEQTSLMV